MPVPDPYTGAFPPILAAQLGYAPAAPYKDVTGVTTTSVLIPGASEAYRERLQANFYAPAAQIFAAAAAPAVAAISAGALPGKVVGQIAQAVLKSAPKNGGLSMDFTSPSIPTGNGWFGPLVGLASQAISAFAQTPAERIPTPSVETFGKGGLFQIGQAGDVGVTAAALCKRPKYRVIAVKEGNLTKYHAVAYCPRRRMNPLNARALSRAARRLAMFTSIVGRIEKQVQKSFRRSGGRIRSTARRRCGATPCRCGRC